MNQLYLMAALSALAAILSGGLFLGGVMYERSQAELRDLQDYKEGTEDAQDATSDLPDDDSSRIEWLHEWLGR